MPSMSKLMVAVLLMAIVAIAHAAHSGSVIRRTYTGNKACTGTATTDTLEVAESCFPISQIGEGLVVQETTTDVSTVADSAGFQCANVIGTTGKAPAALSLFTDNMCSTGSDQYAAIPTSECYTGSGVSDSYKFVCGSCGMTVVDFYNFVGRKELKMRWFTDSACKTQIADSTNLNNTGKCVADRDGVSSFSFFCPAAGDCTLVNWDDTTDCCWTPTGENFKYGTDFTDGSCVQRGNNWVRITSGDLSAASTTRLSILSILAAAVALLLAHQL